MVVPPDTRTTTCKAQKRQLKAVSQHLWALFDSHPDVLKWWCAMPVDGPFDTPTKVPNSKLVTPEKPTAFAVESPPAEAVPKGPVCPPSSSSSSSSALPPKPKISPGKIAQMIKKAKHESS